MIKRVIRRIYIGVKYIITGRLEIDIKVVQFPRNPGEFYA